MRTPSPENNINSSGLSSPSTVIDDPKTAIEIIDLVSPVLLGRELKSPTPDTESSADSQASLNYKMGLATILEVDSDSESEATVTVSASEEEVEEKEVVKKKNAKVMPKVPSKLDARSAKALLFRMTSNDDLGGWRRDKTFRLVSVEKQAKENDGYGLKDFVGEARYFQVNRAQGRKLVGGEYAIVYARPYPSGHEEHDYDTYPPNLRGTVIQVFTNKLQGQNINKSSRFINDALGDGFWGAGILKFNGQKVLFKLGRDNDGLETSVDIDLFSVDKEADNKTLLEAVLQEEALMPYGSRVSFGVKSMGFELTVNGNEQEYGFEFARFVLRFDDGREGMEQLVVAVKVPSGKDVGSAFLLKQPIQRPPNNLARTYEFDEYDEMED